MPGKKDITSCSIMINSKDPEQQSLSIYPKIRLLSHHSPNLKTWSLSSNWAGLFAHFGIYLVHSQIQIFAHANTCLEQMVFTIQIFLIFQSPSKILPTPRRLSWLLYPHFRNLSVPQTFPTIFIVFSAWLGIHSSMLFIY